MDPGNQPGANAHRVIAERLEKLHLPTHNFISMSIDEFLDGPTEKMAELTDGDYYFASIVPGVHLAHCPDAEQVINFVKQFKVQNPTSNEQIYISLNFESAMSGHIIVKDDPEPNSIQAEFTTSNFNTFHRGQSTPEISISRSDYRFNWRFGSQLQTSDGWRDEQLFECNSGLKLNRPQMAKKIFETIMKIPHDGHLFQPGYYEVLIEDIGNSRTRPVFIEAIPTSL